MNILKFWAKKQEEKEEVTEVTLEEIFLSVLEQFEVIDKKELGLQLVNNLGLDPKKSFIGQIKAKVNRELTDDEEFKVYVLQQATGLADNIYARPLLDEWR